MFTELAPYAGFGMKLVFGNVWLFGPVLKSGHACDQCPGRCHAEDDDRFHGAEGLRCL